MTATLSAAVFPNWTSHFVEKDGLRLHYLDHGGEGPVLLCLHGTSMQAHAWGHLAASLAGAARVIALDMRGHGQSDRPATTYTMSELAGDVAWVADAIGLERFALAGSSVGNQVAVAFAAAHPERVTGLLLSDPSFFVGDGEIVKYLRSHHTRPRHFATRDEAEAYGRTLTSRAGLSEHMHALTLVGDFRQVEDGSWTWAYDLPAITKIFLNLSTDQSADVAAVKAPVRILHAARSNMLGAAQAQGLLEAFADAELITVDNSNHTIWGDRPDLLAELARSFLPRLA